MSPLGERLAWIITALGAALGAYGRRIAYPPQPVWLGTRCYTPLTPPEPLPRLAPDVWALFWRRVTRTGRRFQALYEAWKSGTLKPVAPRPTRVRTVRPQPMPGIAPTATTATATPLRLPRGFGWAKHRAEETVTSAGMLSMLVEDAETRRFVAEVPRAGRLLRPLCQALGIRQPDYLRRPSRPRTPRPAKPPRPRRLKLTDPALNLQPYVIRAARYMRRKYGRD